MSRHNHAHLIVEREISQLVDDANPNTADLQLGRDWKSASPAARVVVAAHRGDGCDGAQLVEDFRLSDVAGVNDVGGAAQELDRLRSQETVGIGDKPDPRQRMKLTVPSTPSSIESRMASRLRIFSFPESMTNV